MNGDELFVVTEWEWFKIQLRLYSVEFSRSENLNIYYSFESDKRKKILCDIHNTYAREMIEQKITKKEQMEYYKGWIDLEKGVISKILNDFPSLKNDFDPEKDIVFEIMYDYGMGAASICKIIGKKIYWGKEYD